MGRMTGALPAHKGADKKSRTEVIGVFAGEGIGPEVVAVALEVLDALAQSNGRRFDVRMGGLIGKEAMLLSGNCLPDEAGRFCESVFADGGALFCGAGGARFVYDLRARFDLFCKFTPLQPNAALRDSGVLRPERLDGVDIIAVRENVAGLYFGQWQRGTDEAGQATATQQFGYRHDQVERILGAAGRLAAGRRGRLCVVLKPDGVPTISALWQECAEALQQTVDLDAVEILEVDNAAYQLIADPQRFDVIVSPNMFGDVLADCGSLLIGSRGMSYSGNFSADGKAVYQTGHGAARDLAGADCANPVGQLLALAMLLDESLGWPQGATAVRDAITRTLAAGWRTPDIAGPNSRVVGTRELGARIRDALRVTAEQS